MRQYNGARSNWGFLPRISGLLMGLVNACGPSEPYKDIGQIAAKSATLIPVTQLGQREPIAQTGALGMAYRTLSGEVEHFFCSGTLIRPDVVLTAAHCLRGLQAAPSEDIESLAFYPQAPEPFSGVKPQKIAVRGIALHPGYIHMPESPPLEELNRLMEDEKASTYITQRCGVIDDGSAANALRWMLDMPSDAMLRREERFWWCLQGLQDIPNQPPAPIAPTTAMHDIAMVFLQAPVSDIEPILLAPAFTHGNGGDELIAAGYGIQNPDGPVFGDRPQTQKAGKVDILGWGAFELQHDGAQSQTCFGDSGGSLYRHRGDTLELVGVLVRVHAMPLSMRCSGSGIATNVTAYADWIDEVISSGSWQWLNP